MSEPEQKEAELWEDRQLRKNGHGGYVVAVPKNWVEAMKRPASEVISARILFIVKDGKPTIALIPGSPKDVYKIKS